MPCASSSTRCAARPSGSSERVRSGRPREILYGRIPALERQIAEAAEAEDEDDVTDRLVGEEVAAQQIAEVVEAWTGIPTGKMLQGEQAKLLEMEDGDRSPADRAEAPR